MKASALKYAVLSLAASLCLLIIAIIPFHAFLTVWAASSFSHYTSFRLWKEIILVIIGVAVLFLAMTDFKIRSHTFTRRLVQLVLAYIVLHLVFGVIALKLGHVTPKALGYAWLVDLRFLVFFLLVWSIAIRSKRMRSNWHNLILIPAGIVVAFGLLQFLVLPDDFLRHFGYNAMTIEPYETVNSNRDFVRVTSTLRGPNPLGAYLIIPIATAAVLAIRAERKWRYILFTLLALTVVGASFSRSAVLGALISIGIIIVLSARSAQAKNMLKVAAVGVVLVVVLGFSLVHKNSRIETVVLHTQTNSKVATSSNDGHIKAVQEGVSSIVHEPLGRGPGTAGPASVYNNGITRIAENYFIQIGQEVGILD